MIVTGYLLSEKTIDGVELLQAKIAQSYIANLEGQLSKLDGAPVFLVHDKETGTSDAVVANLENALIAGTNIENLPIYITLQACFKEGVNFRIWWADNNRDAYKNNSNSVNDLDSALNSIKNGRGAWWHSR